MIYNSIYKTFPSVLHKSGPFNHAFFDKLFKEIMMTNKSLIPSDSVTIVTWNNTKKAGLLQQCLNHFNLNCEVLGGKIENWRNPLKIELLLEFLEQVKTPYILGADDFDVLLFHNIDLILDKFKKQNCKLLYNAGPVNFPVFENIGNFEKNIGKNFLHPYLNAGVFIGEVEFCKKFYFEAYNRIGNKIDIWLKSEQIYIKNIFPEFYPAVKIDYRCELFQIINNLSPYSTKNLQLQKPKIL